MNSHDPYGPHIDRSGETLIINGDDRHTISRTGGRVQFDGTPPEVSSGSMIQKAVTETGSPRTGSDITEDSVVSITGIPMKIRDAMRAGLIERTHDGGFSVVTPGAKAPQDNGPAGDDEAGGLEELAPHIEDSITHVARNASPGDVLNVVSSYAKDGTMNEAALGRIASQLGIEPGDAHGRFEEIRSSMETQARLAVSKAGGDPDAVFEWAWANRPDLMQKAIKSQATERTTKGYGEIAKAYLANNNPYSADDIVNAQFPEGVSARKLHNGEVVLNVNGLEIAWKDAMRRGLVNVSRVR